MARSELGNEREWRAALDHKFEQVDKATWRAVREGLHIVERSTKKILRTHTHPVGTPTTSPPGEPPALVTGTLMRSVKSTRPRRGKAAYSVEGDVGPTVEYARIQELGGDIERAFGVPGLRVSLPARPYAKPATDRVRRDVRRLFVTRWTDALLS